MASEEFIRNQIRKIIAADILIEAGGTPGVTRGSVGRGRIKDQITRAGALAKEKPQDLMRSLGVRSAAGSTTEEKVMDIVKKSMMTADVMKEAYTGAQWRTTPDNKKFIQLNSSISPRDAAYYMLHVLTGALNAGLLSDLDKEVRVGVTNFEGDKIAIVQFVDAT